MIRTGEEYRESIKDSREVYIAGEKVKDVTSHPAFKPIVDVKAKIYDMQHSASTKDVMTYQADNNEVCAIALKLPQSKQDWWDKKTATNLMMNEVGGVVTRVGDETVGEMWSLYDSQEALNGINSEFSDNIKNHINNVIINDTFHLTANTDPKGDRSKAPQLQDPDMRLHVVRETDRGIVVRGAKFETAAAYANQAYTKPTIANWEADTKFSDYALGFICNFSSPGLKIICRDGFADKNPLDYPIATKFDEIEALVIFDDVEIPWEDVLFYRNTQAAKFIHTSLHRYSAFAFIQRNLKVAELLIGASILNVQQTGVDNQVGVQERLSKLACYREGIDAHLISSIAMAEKSPSGLVMPNQSLLYAGRVFACSQLYEMVNVARELGGGQVCLTPNYDTFNHDETKPWLDKFYNVNAQWPAEERRKLLAYSRDLCNSDYAGHRLTFQEFAQSPRFAHLASVYHHFDFDGPAELVRQAAGLSQTIQSTQLENTGVAGEHGSFLSTTADILNNKTRL
ncbi:4-hydroxyphenylacetate 3-hydroxylase family protein [Vibrio sp. RC27]